MPLIKSAIKRARQNVVRRTRLLPYRTHLKTMVRKFMDLVKEGKKDEAAKLLPLVFKTIDISAKKNLLHRNTADRKKSRMSRMLAA
ncbi:MAG: 30S ribosomal protein S20 [Candidatus Peribacteraceae bacterium]|jgi:small subunit ribosomal protein S20